MTNTTDEALNEPSPHAYDDSLFATSRIDPTAHKAAKNSTIIDRTKFAIAGLIFSLRRERSVRNIAYTTVLVMSLASWLRLDRVRLLVVFNSLALVWVAELVNSAVEATVDLASPRKRHDMAKVAKDVAASATFVATLTSAITSMIVILPPLLRKLAQMLGLSENTDQP